MMTFVYGMQDQDGHRLNRPVTVVDEAAAARVVAKRLARRYWGEHGKVALVTKLGVHETPTGPCALYSARVTKARGTPGLTVTFNLRRTA